MDTATELSAALAANAEAFCRHWLPSGRKVGNYWMIGDKTGTAGRSMAVRLRPYNGRQAGKWTDHSSGEHGDLLDIIAERIGDDDWRTIFSEARRFLGQPDLPPTADAPATTAPSRSDQADKARKLYGYGRPITGTPAERYLRARAITRFGPALRFHEGVYFRDTVDGSRRQLPAMLAAITDNDGNFTGCARTWLDTDNDRVASIEEPKRVIGNLAGNAVRFQYRASPDLIAGEGIESVLSVGTAFPVASLAACLTANHLGMFDPPSSLRRLWIARDNDEAGRESAFRLRQRAESLGIAVFDLVPVRNDFNDDLREFGLMALRLRLQRHFARERAFVTGVAGNGQDGPRLSGSRETATPVG